MQGLREASKRVDQWLDTVVATAVSVDQGVWWLGEGKSPKGLIPVSGHLVVAFSAGPDLLPVGTSHPGGPALLVQLAQRVREVVSDMPDAPVRLVAVTDPGPDTRRLLDELDQLSGRLGLGVSLQLFTSTKVFAVPKIATGPSPGDSHLPGSARVAAQIRRTGGLPPPRLSPADARLAALLSRGSRNHQVRRAIVTVPAPSGGGERWLHGRDGLGFTADDVRWLASTVVGVARTGVDDATALSNVVDFARAVLGAGVRPGDAARLMRLLRAVWEGVGLPTKAELLDTVWRQGLHADQPRPSEADAVLASLAAFVDDDLDRGLQRLRHSPPGVDASRMSGLWFLLWAERRTAMAELDGSGDLPAAQAAVDEAYLGAAAGRVLTPGMAEGIEQIVKRGLVPVRVLAWIDVAGVVVDGRPVSQLLPVVVDQFGVQQRDPEPGQPAASFYWAGGPETGGWQPRLRGGQPGSATGTSAAGPAQRPPVWRDRLRASSDGTGLALADLLEMERVARVLLARSKWMTDGRSELLAQLRNGRGARAEAAKAAWQEWVKFTDAAGKLLESASREELGDALRAYELARDKLAALDIGDLIPAAVLVASPAPPATSVRSIVEQLLARFPDRYKRSERPHWPLELLVTAVPIPPELAFTTGLLTRAWWDGDPGDRLRPVLDGSVGVGDDGLVGFSVDELNRLPEEEAGEEYVYAVRGPDGIRAASISAQAGSARAPDVLGQFDGRWVLAAWRIERSSSGVRLGPLRANPYAKVRNAGQRVALPNAAWLDREVAGMVARRAAREGLAFARGVDAPADTPLEYGALKQILRSANGAFWAEMQSVARVARKALAGEEGPACKKAAWEWLINSVRHKVGVPEFGIESSTASGLEATFDTDPWSLELPIGADHPVDQLFAVAGHEFAHAETATWQGRLLAGATNNPDILPWITNNRDVQIEFWEQPLKAGHPSYPAALQLWWNLFRTHKTQVVLQASGGTYSGIGRGAYAALGRAEETEGFDPVVLDRLKRRHAAATRLLLENEARYFQLLPEQLAYHAEREIEKLGSMSDWSESWGSVLRLGYQVVVSRAGAYVWPAPSPRLDDRPRLAHPDRPLVSIQVNRLAEARFVIEQLSVRLAGNALLELVTREKIDGQEAIWLAGLVRHDQRLMVEEEWAHVDVSLRDHFVAYTWWHKQWVPGYGGYLTVHTSPPLPNLYITGLPLMYNMGDGVWQLSEDWHFLQPEPGGMLWLAPADLPPGTRPRPGARGENIAAEDAGGVAGAESAVGGRLRRRHAGRHPAWSERRGQPQPRAEARSRNRGAEDCRCAAGRLGPGPRRAGQGDAGVGLR